MIAAAHSGGFGRAGMAAVSYRVARVFLLLLLVIISWEPITAVREIALFSGVFFLGLSLIADPQRRLHLTPLWPALLLYVAVAALSLVWAVDRADSLGEFRSEVLKGLLIYYLGAHFIVRAEHVKQVWGALLVSAAIMGLAGIYYFYAAGGSLVNYLVRAGSLHNGYGGLGTYLASVWPFVLLAPRAFAGSRLRPWLWALAGLTAFLGFITYNRACWAAMLIGAALCFLMQSRRRLRAALIIFAACAVLAGGLLLMPGATHGERWQKMFKDPASMGGTAGDLYALWSHSWREIKKDPFRGIGVGRESFTKAYPEFIATHQALLWHSHNMFVGLALQMGVQGLAAMLLVMIMLWAFLWPQAPPAAGDLAGLFCGAAAVGVVAFAVRNLTDNFFADDSALTFWFLAGLAMAARRFANRAD